ncbi:transcriptional regulator, MarR family [Enhydrobacter aerosaccus]|uniref:Transcriptional regulator, MarR family n=1 Tax=Enhydrobacter aerosaccus TaxID=225324 RepID=A0A1T4TE43_9HYPH|nr:MarR family transcriptional regulator [Enhydrobacter aerosaccus]SKA38696.1 transcriptional regulator, MarR family [Enhydrobacter aerosaccus]
MARHQDRPASAEAIVEELLQATGQLLRRLRAESNPSELTWSQSAALARLDKNGPTTTADLARAEAVKPQSMGVTLAALEQDGLIERRPHPTDGRQVLFALTEKGVAVRRKHRLLKREWLAAALGKLDPEAQRTLAAAVSVLRRLGDS